MMRLFPLLALLMITSSSSVFAQKKQGAPEKLSDGIVVTLGQAFLKVEVCNDDLIRIAYSPDRAFFARRSLVAEVRRCVPVQWKLATNSGEATLTTARLKVKVDLVNGAVSFFDLSGRAILVERKSGRTLTAAEVQGEKTFNVRQEWEPNVDESLYGLGQHQLG